ncbi:MAG: hypothetical protein LBE72_06210 [Rickettsia sp.]|nr:hypothetical protein [Rickettsia sp.]
MTEIFLTSKTNNRMLYIHENIKAKDMIKKTILMLTTLLVSSTALANSSLETEGTTSFIVTPSVAYRYDIFKWSIPDDIFPQKKLSELVWKNHIVQPSIKIETEPQANQFTILGQVKYGYILKNQSKSWDHDWDHTRDRIGNVISKLRSTTKSQATGNILDLSGAVGYSLDLFKDSLLTFYVGYDYSDYRNKNYGDIQLAYKTNFSFSLGGLNQKYNFKNLSPWVGLSLNTPLNEKFIIIPTIKFYSFKYIGKGYWIHRGDFHQNPSFKQNAKGTGLGFDVDFVYKYSDNLDLTLNLESKRFKIKKGTEKLFYNTAAFGGERVASGKLLDLSLMSSTISFGVNYKL